MKDATDGTQRPSGFVSGSFFSGTGLFRTPTQTLPLLRSHSVSAAAPPLHPPPSASTSDRRPPRELLYHQKHVPLREFARDFSDGTIASYGKLSYEEKRARFGSNIVPIFVPLADGESPEQYEQRFVAWLVRQQNVTLQELENDEDEKRERYYRMRFAAANARGVQRFTRRESDPDGERDRDHRYDDDHRHHHHDNHRSDHDRDNEKRRDRRDSPSPSRSMSSTTSRDARSDRHVKTSVDHPDRTDDRQRMRRSQSPTRSTSSSMGSLPEQLQRYGRHPFTGKRVPREALYATKHVELAQYRLDYRQHNIEHWVKMPDKQKLEMFGSTIIPIHVPLARGESIRQYEERFVKWLGGLGFTLRELENHVDESLERVYRIKFANLNAKGLERFTPADTKHDRPESALSPRPAKKVARGEDRPSSVVDITASKATTPTSGGARRHDTPSTVGADAKASTRRECSFSEPPQGAPTSAVAAGYTACGCRSCLVTGVRFLSDKAAQMAPTACPKCTTKASSNPRGVVDLTQDDDDHPRSSRNTTARFAAAIAKLVISRGTIEDLKTQGTTAQHKPGTMDALADDPVENHLFAEYEKINQSILNLETKLRELVAQIAKTPVTDTETTTHLQHKSQQLRERIQKESDDRRAALAMVVVHVWRHKKPRLERILRLEASKNVPLVQRTSHEKIATLTPQIAAAQQRARHN